MLTPRQSSHSLHIMIKYRDDCISRANSIIDIEALILGIFVNGYPSMTDNIHAYENKDFKTPGVQFFDL
jgi:hypothetical protein